MGNHQHTDSNEKKKAAGRALLGVGMSGAVALTGGMPGHAAPHADHHRTHTGKDISTNDLLRQLARANADLASLKRQLATDRERANKALVDVKNAQAHAEEAQKKAHEARKDLERAHKELEHAQKQLNTIAADAYRHAATSNTAADLMAGVDPDAVLAREALIQRTAAQQSKVVSDLKIARTKSAKRAASAKEAEIAADRAQHDAEVSHHEADEVLQAATQAVREKEREISRLEKERADLTVHLYDVRSESSSPDIQIDKQELIEALALTGDFARAAAAANVDISSITSVEDLAGLPSEVLQAIPPELWKRLGTNTQRQVGKKSPELANLLRTSQQVAEGEGTITDLIGPNIEVAKAGIRKAKEIDTARKAAEAEKQSSSGSEQTATPPGTSSSSSAVASPPLPAFDITTMFLPVRQKIDKVVNRGMSQLGVPYAWGGGDVNGPTRGIRDGGVADSYGDYNKVGFDCSGLMVYAFAALGYNLPHYSGYQYTSGLQLPLAQMRRGDMIFYGPGGSQHVALYLGDGMMLEAPQSGDVVKVNPIRWDGIAPMVVRMVTS